MSFWSSFAEHYERVFPYQPAVGAFLEGRLPAEAEAADGHPRVLDLGCGSGHYAARLARSMARVLGVDPDPGMVATARTSHPGLAGLRFEVAGTADFETALASDERPLDLAFAVGNVLAHEDQAGLGRCLERLAALLAPRGRVVIQTVNFDRILDAGLGADEPAGRFDFPLLEIPAEGEQPALSFRRSYEDLSAAGTRFVTQLAADGVEVFRGEVPMFPQRAREVDELARAAGFGLLERFGNFAGAAFEAGSSPAAVLVLGH